MTHKLSSQSDERPSKTSVFRVVNWLHYKSSSFSEVSPAKTPSGTQTIEVEIKLGYLAHVLEGDDGHHRDIPVLKIQG